MAYYVLDCQNKIVEISMSKFMAVMAKHVLPFVWENGSGFMCLVNCFVTTSHYKFY